MKQIVISLCLLFALAVYVPAGFITAAYVHEHRAPAYPETQSEFVKEERIRWHNRDSFLSGVAWPAYWFGRGSGWALTRCWNGAVCLVTPCEPPPPTPLTDLDIVRNERDRWYEEYQDLTREDPLKEARDSAEFWRDQVERERKVQAERSGEPWPGASEGKQRPYEEPPSHLNERTRR